MKRIAIAILTAASFVATPALADSYWLIEGGFGSFSSTELDNRLNAELDAVEADGLTPAYSKDDTPLVARAAGGREISDKLSIEGGLFFTLPMTSDYTGADSNGNSVVHESVDVTLYGLDLLAKHKLGTKFHLIGGAHLSSVTWESTDTLTKSGVGVVYGVGVDISDKAFVSAKVYDGLGGDGDTKITLLSLGLKF